MMSTAFDYSDLSSSEDEPFGRVDRAFLLLAAFGITRRQLECLAWVQEGKSSNDIGGILGISGRTVDGHIAKLCARLDVKSRMQAVLKVRDIRLPHSPHP